MTENNPTFLVNYEDGTSDIIKPVSWKFLDEVEALQLEILKAAYEVNFSLSNLFRPKNVKFWDNAKKLANLLPVVGQDEKGFDPERIDSMDELCRIFVSTSEYRKPETGSVWNSGELLEPSEICRIHHLNFIDLLLTVEKQIQAQSQTQEEAKPKATRTKKASTTN